MTILYLKFSLKIAPECNTIYYISVNGNWVQYNAIGRRMHYARSKDKGKEQSIPFTHFFNNSVQIMFS